MRERRRRKLLWEPGCIPAPGGLLEWRDSRHFDRWQELPCVLCKWLTPMRSHYEKPVQKACAEAWIAANSTGARLGRFASDIQPKSSRDNDHA
ncbi:hypothetical protein ABZ468_48825 [Streptomyces sp. NPDC005708]|uniref:hypothetical protein n=1 Tax=Streptomyces sp. NPDC005708 TaxID=3154564 RepID=UPI0033D3AA5D